MPKRICAAAVGELMVWATKRVAGDLRVSGFDHIRQCRRQGRPIIFAGWHGHNLVNMAAYYTVLRGDFRCAIMVPEIAKGMVLDYLGRKIDIDVVKVGSGLGPAEWASASAAMIRLIRRGRCALLSPDGPNGPAFTVKPGIALMGRRARAVVIPASAASHRAVKLRYRWDDHLVPLPWSRTVVHFGAPIDAYPPEGPRPSAGQLQESIGEALAWGARKAEALCRESLDEHKELP